MLIIISINTRTINTNSVGPPTDSIIPLVSAIEGERDTKLSYTLHDPIAIITSYIWCLSDCYTASCTDGISFRSSANN